MPEFPVSLLSVHAHTPDVNIYRTERPSGYTFVPGQATEVAVDQVGWTTEARPFTFTSLPSDPWLEFTIKSYRDHDGVTKLLGTLKPGARLLLHDVWGALTYRGPGLFLAGGAGITPFLSIFRDLAARKVEDGKRLLFGNKTGHDVIREAELRSYLGEDFRSYLSQETLPGHRTGHIGLEAVRSALTPGDWIYLCGPDPMVESLTEVVKALGLADRLVVED